MSTGPNVSELIYPTGDLEIENEAALVARQQTDRLVRKIANWQFLQENPDPQGMSDEESSILLERASKYMVHRENGSFESGDLFVPNNLLNFHRIATLFRSYKEAGDKDFIDRAVLQDMRDNPTFVAFPWAHHVPALDGYILKQTQLHQIFLADMLHHYPDSAASVGAQEVSNE